MTTVPVRKIYKWWPASTQAALWHCTHQDSEYLPGNRRTALAITVHDLNFLERQDYSKLKKNLKIKRLQRKINRARGIAYISAFVRDWTHEHLRIPAGTVEHVIYNGNNLDADTTSAARPEWQQWEPYLFSIGIHPKKNYAALLPMFQTAAKGYRWVVAGTDGRGYQAEMARQAARLGVADRLIFTGNVTEEEKKWLYENCSALLFPSLSEGFGLPVVEAMSCGKPVFLSDRTSLPEIGGEEAYYFADFEAETLTKTFEQGMENYSRNPEKPKRLKARANQFSWEKAAKEYLGFYREITETRHV